MFIEIIAVTYDLQVSECC